MIRKLPLIPTILVAFAAAVMIALGVWQLSRAEQKDALLARYAAAKDQPPIAWPAVPPADDALPLFRRAAGYCLQPLSRRVTAGRNRAGQSGFIHVVSCRTGAEGPGMAVDIGWTHDPRLRPSWSGGEVSGVIAPDGKYRMRLVADEAADGLQPSAPPDIESIPNNHLMYAVQWFLFAVIAVVIYLLAVRKRLQSAGAPKP